MIGQTIAHYRIIEKLGQGGMGVVYRAEDTRLGRDVALKFPPPQTKQSAEEYQRLIHEAKAAASLDHPNICTIHEIGEVDGQPYIAMSFVDGMTLRDRLANGPLPAAEAVKIAMQMADGLSVAHDKGIIHRDIKPENIMINARGQVKIMDFGLAKSTRFNAKITQDGITPGTAAYMSPEQAKGEGVDARSDLWSLGVVLYECLTVHLPFEGSHPAALMYAVLHEPHRAMDTYRGNLPSELTSLIDRLLRKDPIQRPVDTRAVAQELSQIRDLLDGKVSSHPGVRDPAQPSLAVLPFTNMSADAENEFFADGLTEDLITAFSRMNNLRVVARTSAFQFKGKTTDIRRVGEQLNVGTVLEGSVRKSGNRLRVTAQLINVADGFHIWSEKYDREMADVFEIQDDIARAIVDALKVKLTGQPDASLVRGGTANLEAYNLVLQGRHHWNRRTGADLLKAEDCFRRAIALDPQYALAHGVLAMTYVTMLDHTDAPREELSANAARAAAEALRLDSECAEAYATIGLLEMDANRWGKSEVAFRRAIAINPGFVTGHQWYATLLSVLGRFEEVMRELRIALSHDPLSLIVHTNLAHAYRILGRMDDYRRELEYATEIDPNFAPVHMDWIMYHEVIGDYDRAILHGERLLAINPSYQRVNLWIARLRILSGDSGAARDAFARWLESLNDPERLARFQRAAASGTLASFKAAVLAEFRAPIPTLLRFIDPLSALLMELEEWDAVFDWLEAAAKVSVYDVSVVLVDPMWERARKHPRYPAFHRSLALPQSV